MLTIYQIVLKTLYELIIFLKYFCGINCDLSSFIHNFIYLGPFSFLFDKSGQGFINFINSFKEPAPSFGIKFYLQKQAVGWVWAIGHSPPLIYYLG